MSESILQPDTNMVKSYTESLRRRAIHLVLEKIFSPVCLSRCVPVQRLTDAPETETETPPPKEK